MTNHAAYNNESTSSIDLTDRNLVAVEVLPDAYEYFRILTEANGGLPANAAYRGGAACGMVFRRPGLLRNGSNYTIAEGVSVRVHGMISGVVEPDLIRAAELPEWLFPPTDDRFRAFSASSIVGRGGGLALAAAAFCAGGSFIIQLTKPQ